MSLDLGNVFDEKAQINYDVVAKLSDEDFANFYLSLMKEYKDLDGWWGVGGNIPSCTKCRVPIKSFEELRRYAGQSLHSICFSEIWIKEGGVYTHKLRKDFFDRVTSNPHLNGIKSISQTC